MLLVAYVAVGAMGHLGTLTRVFSFNAEPSRFTQTRQTPSKDGRVFWTQQRHIPSTLRVEVPDADVRIVPALHYPLPIAAQMHDVPAGECATPLAVPAAPRAPPLS